jgi:hypothetical protein
MDKHDMFIGSAIQAENTGDNAKAALFYHAAAGCLSKALALEVKDAGKIVQA